MPTVAAEHDQHHVATFRQLTRRLDLLFDVALERQVLGVFRLITQQDHLTLVNVVSDEFVTQCLLIRNGKFQTLGIRILIHANQNHPFLGRSGIVGVGVLSGRRCSQNL